MAGGCFPCNPGATGYPNYTHIHCVSKKTSKVIFGHNIVRFQPTVIIFCTKMANSLKLSEMRSFSTSPNSRLWPAAAKYGFYPHDAMLARVIAIATCLSVYPSVHLSVRPSVTRRYCVKTKKASGMIASPSGSPKTLVFRRQISTPNSKGFPPNGGFKEGSVGKIQRFLPARRYASAGNSDRNVSVCPSVSLSVRLSVTRRYCVKTKKASGMISSPSGSTKTLVF